MLLLFTTAETALVTIVCDRQWQWTQQRKVCVYAHTHTCVCMYVFVFVFAVGCPPPPRISGQEALFIWALCDRPSAKQHINIKQEQSIGHAQTYSGSGRHTHTLTGMGQTHKYTHTHTHKHTHATGAEQTYTVKLAPLCEKHEELLITAVVLPRRWVRDINQKSRSPCCPTWHMI